MILPYIYFQLLIFQLISLSHRSRGFFSFLWVPLLFSFVVKVHAVQSLASPAVVIHFLPFWEADWASLEHPSLFIREENLTSHWLELGHLATPKLQRWLENWISDIFNPHNIKNFLHFYMMKKCILLLLSISFCNRPIRSTWYWFSGVCWDWFPAYFVHLHVLEKHVGSRIY